MLTCAGSNATRASLSLKLTSARCTPVRPSRARLTAIGQTPQTQSGARGFRWLGASGDRAGMKS
jgi:hypothetical protein